MIRCSVGNYRSFVLRVLAKFLDNYNLTLHRLRSHTYYKTYFMHEYIVQLYRPYKFILKQTVVPPHKWYTLSMTEGK